MANNSLRRNLMNDSSDALAELLTLTLTVDQWGDRIYRNPMGQLHREHGAAIEYTNGDNYWYLNDQPHRTDGPAVECANGDMHWYINGKLHRTTGPAVECADGTKSWYQNGQRHRTDGPAIEWPDGTRVWYLDGQQLSEKEFHERFK